jgi:peptidoglycan/LPS O-acetylase OafA/YrhL
MGAFRRDLEGLRGLALAMVIGLHAELLPGGFVGVDVFFVLSGFLMTCTLMRDEQSSLLQFLSRRAWRLVPASVGVLFLVLIVSHFVLVPSVFVEVGRSAIAASAHVANIHFLLRESGYFVDAANPLLHFWSLAVEWQFYVVFPLVLPWLVHASWMLWAAILGLSFCSAHLVSTDAAYYLLPFRAGEFLVGTVVALQGEEQKVPRFTSVVCLAVLLLCSVMFSSALPFPGLLALIPCLATAGLIASKESDV